MLQTVQPARVSTNDLAGGHIPLGVTDMPSAIALIRDGKIKPLAVSTRQRLPALADVPTVEEAGLPGFESMGWFGIEVAAHEVNADNRRHLLARLKELATVAVNQ